MKYLLLSFAIIVIFLTGCGTVSDTLYLQDLEVTTPLSIPPMQLTTSASRGKLIFSPKFYIYNSGRVEGTVSGPPVNSSGYYQVDTVDGELLKSSSNLYPFQGKNMRWNIPDVLAGFDIDFPISQVLSFNGGLNFSSYSGKGLMGGSFGISLSGASDNAGVRFSTGFAYQQFSYKALTIVERKYNPWFGNEKTSVYFYNDNGGGSNLNFYMSLMGNSDYPDFLINFYLGISFFYQDIVDFKANQLDFEKYPFLIHTTVDARGEYTSSFFGFNPGIYKDIGDWGRLVGGANIIIGLKDLNNATRTSFILPFVKMEFFL